VSPHRIESRRPANKKAARAAAAHRSMVGRLFWQWDFEKEVSNLRGRHTKRGCYAADDQQHPPAALCILQQRRQFFDVSGEIGDLLFLVVNFLNQMLVVLFEPYNFFALRFSHLITPFQ
jgi:hypothetical protein